MNPEIQKASAIAWEIWRKNHRGYALVLAGTTLVGVLARWLGPEGDPVPQGFAGGAMMMSFLATFAAFTYGESGRRLGFPARPFTLPIGTGTLVGVPILLGALAITLVHLVWAVLFFVLNVDAYPVGAFAVFWVAALVVFQATVWCLARHPKTLVLALVAALSLLGYLAAGLVGDTRHDEALAGLAVLIPAGWVAARVGVGGQRCGRRRLMDAAQERLEEWAGALLRGRRHWKSPARAQLWMEWRANAVAPVLALAVGLVPVCLTWIRIAAADQIGVLATAWFYFTGFLALFWACVSGLWLARDAGSRATAISSFLATRPVTSGDLAFAKLKLAGALTLVGWVVYGLNLALAFNLFFRPSELPMVRSEDELAPAAVFIALALTWHLVGALPLWLTGRIPGIAWAALVTLGFYIVALNAVQFINKHFGLLRALPWLLGAAFVVKAAVAGWSFGESLRRGLLTRRAVAGYLLFWSVTTACCLAVAALVCQGTPFEDGPVLLAAVLLVPLARVGLAPLGLARARHR